MEKKQIEVLENGNVRVTIPLIFKIAGGRTRIFTPDSEHVEYTPYTETRSKEYINMPQLRFCVQHYVNFYNSRRIHSALQYRMPNELYFGTCNRHAMRYSNSKAFIPTLLIKSCSPWGRGAFYEK